MYGNPKGLLGMKVGMSIPSVFRGKIDDLVIAILNRKLDSQSLIDFVITQWHYRAFVMKYSDMSALNLKILAMAEGVIESYHGKKNQPISTSRHLYGDSNTVSVRLVFDPPTDKNMINEIEPHTHPVASIIVVTQGGGEFFLLYNEERLIQYVRVPLSPGAVVCFPASVTHTIKPGNEGIQTLNVTDRKNQPPYRYDHHFYRNMLTFQILPDIDFSSPADIPKEAEHMDYFAFIEYIRNPVS